MRLHMSVKILPELRKYLEEKARKEGRSMSNMLERIIEQDKNKGK